MYGSEFRKKFTRNTVLALTLRVLGQFDRSTRAACGTPLFASFTVAAERPRGVLRTRCAR